MSTLMEKSQQILDEKQAKILPENLKNGITAFGVTGELSGTNFWLGNVYCKESTDISKWGNNQINTDMTEAPKLGDIGFAVSNFEVVGQREPDDFETNGIWYIYLPNQYTLETKLLDFSPYTSYTFSIHNSYMSTVEFNAVADKANNYYAIYIGRGNMHATPVEYGLASSDGIHFKMKRFNRETYKYDIDDDTGVNIIPLYPKGDTLCDIIHSDYSVCTKLKQLVPNFYNLIFGTEIAIKNNVIGRYNGTNWERI